MKTRTLSYAAGLMDGDGHVGVSRSKTESGYKYYPDVTITNQSPALMRWLRLHFGGVVKHQTSTRGNLYFIWCCVGKRSQKEFLLSILPYLIIKKERARVVVEFLEINGEHPEYRDLVYSRYRKEYALKSVTTETQGLLSKTSKEEMAYLAGLVDTDGHISHYGGYWAIGLTNIHRPVLNMVRNSFGGSLSLNRRTKIPCFNWLTRGTKTIERVVLAILPYMIVKRDIANSALLDVRSKIQSELS